MIDAIEALYPGVKAARVIIEAAQAAEQWEPPAPGNAVQLRNAFFEGFRLGRMYDDGLPSAAIIPANGPEKRRPGRPPKKQQPGQPEPPAVMKTEQPQLTGHIVVCPSTGDAIDSAFCRDEYGCTSNPDTCTANKNDEDDQI